MQIRASAIMVCVDYSDYLAITLPRNRRHFESITIVTKFEDESTIDVAESCNADCFCSDAFHANGADFNKFAAMEQGIESMLNYSSPWIVIMDADVVWPRMLSADFDPIPGKLYTPRRRMMHPIAEQAVIDDESQWLRYPLHPQEREFAGYTQIFHRDDPHLGDLPWHQTNWKHAGGPDSFFQDKWPKEDKIRPPWEVLHLGPSGRNWCGRTTPFLDGRDAPADAMKRSHRLASYMKGRRGKSGAADPFAHEKF